MSLRNIRQARPSDVGAMHRVRVSVKENRLASITLAEHDYIVAIEETGRGWVVELQGDIVAFAVGNAMNGSIWALFVEPGNEGKGYGRMLHDIMVAWLWEQGHQQLWLTTESGTRAERFYAKAGWQQAGVTPRGEVRFEIKRPNNVLHATREDPMTITHIQCGCGAVEMQLTGEPMTQYVCHCDDCQAVHGKAYPVALYSVSAVVVTRGETGTLTLRTTPRTRCSSCGNFLFAEVPGYPFRGVNGDLLPAGRFKPEFHVQCRYAADRIDDDLPHYKDTPTKFRGSGELMS